MGTTRWMNKVATTPTLSLCLHVQCLAPYSLQAFALVVLSLHGFIRPILLLKKPDMSDDGERNKFQGVTLYRPAV
jgi:hypothetical protein